MEQLFISAFITLFVVIDPPGCAPIYAGLTKGASPAQSRNMAIRASIIAFVILLVFALFGQDLLGALHIELDAFRIAGGMLLFLTAMEMLFERRAKRREDQAEDDRPDPSVFPLATPLMAGPGAMASMILLTGEVRGDWAGMAGVLGVMVAVIAVVLTLFLAAGLLERALGRTGINVVTRLLGMLLAALSVQFVLDGLRNFGLAPM